MISNKREHFSMQHTVDNSKRLVQGQKVLGTRRVAIICFSLSEYVCTLRCFYVGLGGYSTCAGKDKTGLLPAICKYMQ